MNSSDESQGSFWCPYNPGDYVPYPPSISYYNDTCPFPTIYQPAWEIALKALTYGVAMLLAVGGNLAVLVAIVFNKHLHTWTNLYLGNLALCDLLVGAVEMWVYLGSDITPDWPFTEAVCKTAPFIQILSLTGSSLFLTAIAAERFLNTVFPLKARFSWRHRHVVIMVAIWATALAMAAPNAVARLLQQIIWLDRRQVWCAEQWPQYFVAFDPVTYSCLMDFPQRRIYYVIQVTTMYIIPVLIMMVAYPWIAVTLWTRNRPGTQTAKSALQEIKTKKKIIRLLIVIFACFIICWTPQEVVVFYDAISPYQSNSLFSADFRYAALYLANLNSSLNPVLYAFLHEAFRRSFQDTICCKSCKHNRVAPVDITQDQNTVARRMRRTSMTLKDSHSGNKKQPQQNDHQLQQKEQQKHKEDIPNDCNDISTIVLAK